jgi:hypothetical protein
MKEFERIYPANGDLVDSTAAVRVNGTHGSMGTEAKKRRVVLWGMLIWAVIAGFFVTDLFVCPWTDVFLH